MELQFPSMKNNQLLHPVIILNPVKNNLSWMAFGPEFGWKFVG